VVGVMGSQDSIWVAGLRWGLLVDGARPNLLSMMRLSAGTANTPVISGRG